jgi:hypothetical protein
LEVLFYATIHARALAWGNARLLARLSKARQQQIADLMDAVHNIPHLLNDWDRCDQKMLRDFLLQYDTKWGQTGGLRLAEVYDRTIKMAH